jgi:hypothetical protein
MTSRLFLFCFFLGAAMLVPAACSAPDDETWVRIISVGEADDSADDANGSGSGAISVLHSDLDDGSPELVDIDLENGTVIVGDTGGGGVLVTVYHASVDYEFGGVAIPSYAYPVTLVIPPPTGGETGTSTTSATLQNFPVVPATLKSWLLVPENLPPDTTKGSFSVVATITLRARSEEGRELETSTSLTVVFN